MTARDRLRRKRALFRPGPTTAQGKRRAARNALQHGLSLAPGAEQAGEIAALAERIAGPDADPRLLDLAQRIAEVQIDLARVRLHRHALIDAALRDPGYEPPKEAARRAKLWEKAERILAGEPIPDWARSRFAPRRREGPEKLAAILAALVPELAALDRYERRALSRRKFAVRAFDRIKAGGG